MRKKILVLLLILVALSYLGVNFAQAQAKEKPKSTKELVKALPEKYRKWLEEEVVYIISPKEKEVFLRLENDRQRDIFIEAFWKQRDPNPDTPENEYKEEHYRRIKYANQNFGKDSPGPGWRTDMGRIYILLGEPSYTEKYENLYDLYPTVIWFYQGMSEYGLPNGFYVVFYKPNSAGEYQLYSPIKDGPQKLMPHYSGDMTDYVQAFDSLVAIEPNVAKVSMSLIEGEVLTETRPSMFSDILLNQKIPYAPIYKLRDTYAEKLFRYKDIIEVEYSANYIDSDALVSVYKSPGGIFYVHYLIEPKKLSLEKDGNKYQTSIEINGMVNDENGRSVYQFDRRLPLSLNEDQVDKIKDRLMSFQDVFPIIPGKYRLSLLFKNVVSKEFSSFETSLNIPDRGLQVSPLLLANKLIQNSQYRGLNKAFLIDDLQFVPSPRNDFLNSDTLYAFFQVWGLTKALREKGTFNYELARESGEVVKSFSKKISEYPERSIFVEELPLADLIPANYTLKVSLLDDGGNLLLSQKANFFITHLGVLSRPWVMTQPQEGDFSPAIQHALGLQYWNKNELEKAGQLLESAYRREPTQPVYALDYCRLLFSQKKYQDVMAVGLPFLKEKQGYDFLLLLGDSSQALGKFEEAIDFYKQYLNHFGTHINVLNSIGECYYRVGDINEALYAWERSLQLEPGQEKLKARVKALKEQKK